jgi:hypothetical protein
VLHLFMTDAGDELNIAPDDSFTRFNMAMVQQYFREEAIHQQHKVLQGFTIDYLLSFLK